MATAFAPITVNALLDLPEREDGQRYELSDGELILKGIAGALHEIAKATAFGILLEYRNRTRSGRAFCESGFVLRPDCARIPDVAWVSNERFAEIPRENLAIAFAPDLAIEIISESENLNQADRKLRDYLDAGVEVWQFFLTTQSAILWTGNQGLRLTGGQLVTSAKLPGFSVPASAFFAE